MKKLFLFGAFISTMLAATVSNGQSSADTSVYTIAESLPFPLLKNCSIELHPGWTLDSVKVCCENGLLALLSRSIRYPDSARVNNIQGTVVTSFIVEKDGKMSNYALLKDIGYGCGQEALRVLQSFSEMGLRWSPAMNEGQPIRMRQTLPLRFRLEEAKPYYMNALGDSVYTDVETYPSFKFGEDSLIRFVVNQLEYPDGYEDSCKTGIIEMSLLVRKDGSILVENQLDFSNLGMDFQFQALRLANKTSRLWKPALFNGKPVTTTLPLRVVFKSNEIVCTAANARYDRAIILADEGATLFGENKTDEAIKKWTESLTLSPDNTEFLYYRGTAFFNQNKKEEGCKDWNRVKEILGVSWFEPMRLLMCGH